MSEHMTESPLISKIVGKKLRSYLGSAGTSFLSYPHFMSIEMTRDERKRVISAIYVCEQADDAQNVIITIKWVDDIVHWALTDSMDEVTERDSHKTAALLCYLMNVTLRGACLYDEAQWWLNQYNLYDPII